LQNQQINDISKHQYSLNNVKTWSTKNKHLNTCFCTTEHTEARAHTQNHCTHTISLATNHFRKTKESALRSSPAVTRLTVYFRAHIQVRPHHFCMMHVLFRLVGMHAGVRACVFARVRVFTSVPVQLCVRARTLACTRVHLRGVCNE
jgi:hypothetical protein